MVELFLRTPVVGLPFVGDSECAAAAVEDMAARCAASGEQDLADWSRAAAQDPSARSILDAIFSNTPFLTDCALCNVEFLRDLLASGPDTALTRIIEDLKDNLSRETERDRLMRDLRVARRRVALLVGLADITGHWPLERVTQALTDFADSALSAVLSHLLLKAAEAGDLVPADPQFPEDRCGFVVLAMGKHGARELNYSSDIDLIVLFDPAAIDYRGRRALQQTLIRMTQALATILQERTPDGFVFRVDLRLRPDPACMPVAIPLGTALAYYESRGANWERAAMIKARAAAGDLELGRRFLEAMGPFVWRPHLDFAMVRDIEDIKRQIADQRGGTEIAFLGHNIKLGRGGIREIEFFAQTHQMVFGGRDPYLRCQRTVDALSHLAEAGHVTDQVADELIEAYEFLRQLEHRLQMVDDQQTQTLPDEESKMARIAAFMAYSDLDPFKESLLHHLRVVEGHFTAFIEDRAPGRAAVDLARLGEMSEEEASSVLHAMGYRDPSSVLVHLERWAAPAFPPARPRGCRQELDRLLPQIVTSAAKAPDPDGALVAFDETLAALPSGRRWLSLLAANSRLLDLLIEVRRTAPALAADLACRPEPLQAAVADEFYGPLPDRRLVVADVADIVRRAPEPQAAVEQAAAWAGEQRLQVAIGVLRGATDPIEAGRAFSAIADGLVGALWARVCRDLEGKACGVAVMACGQYATEGLFYRSPVELMFVHEDGAADTALRLARRLVWILSADTRWGRPCPVAIGATAWSARGPILVTLNGSSPSSPDPADAVRSPLPMHHRPVAGSAKVWEKLAASAAAPSDPRDSGEPPALASDSGFETHSGIGDPQIVLKLFGRLVFALQSAAPSLRTETMDSSPTRALAMLDAAGALETGLAHELLQSHRVLNLWAHILDIAGDAPPARPASIEDDALVEAAKTIESAWRSIALKSESGRPQSPA